MQLNEILEKNSTQDISKKTMISEANIDLLVAEDFSLLPKIKTMGFISILERDYNIDLSQLRKNALSYYDNRTDLEESSYITSSQINEKKGRSKLFPLIILGLLAYASWYFFTQFDKKTLSTLLPFIEDKTKTTEKQVTKEFTPPSEAISSVAQSKKSNVETSINTVNVHTSINNQKILLIPEKKLWFGLIDMENGQREHFSITQKYEIDVTKKSWLLVTSPANFSLINHNETQEYNDARSHYFKVSKAGVEALTRDEYVTQGGYKRW